MQNGYIFAVTTTNCLFNLLYDHDMYAIDLKMVLVIMNLQKMFTNKHQKKCEWQKLNPHHHNRHMAVSIYNCP